MSTDVNVHLVPNQRPKAPLSSFFLFCNSIRDEAKKQLHEQNKTSLGDLQRLLSEKWKNIAPEEKKHFESLAASNKQYYVTALSKWEIQEAVTESPFKELDLFPANTLHRMLKRDRNVKKISSEALGYINQAVVHFLRYLISEADSCRNSRSSVRMLLAKEDVVAAIRRGGLKLKFLQVSAYALDNEDTPEGIENHFKKAGENEEISTGAQRPEGSNYVGESKSKTPKSTKLSIDKRNRRLSAQKALQTKNTTFESFFRRKPVTLS